MYRSIAAGKRLEIPNPGLFADGVCVKKPGAETFKLCRQYLDGIVHVSTAETCAAIKDVFEATRSICEPAGALALAAAKKTAEKGKSYVCIVSGANMNFDRIRFVSEQTEIGEKREAIFECRIPEKMGSFRKFVSRLGKRAVTEFNYRMSDPDHAHVFVGIAVKAPEERVQLAKAFESAGFPTVDLTDDEIAKEHVRHMVGGHTRDVHDEVVLSFEFPEKPGALKKFLEGIAGRWNISLFHYRNHGADHGHVLAGMQVPVKERKEFLRTLKNLGYSFRDVTDNPAYRLFLGNRD
jgi:threonine dehydratase